MVSEGPNPADPRGAASGGSVASRDTPGPLPGELRRNPAPALEIAAVSPWPTGRASSSHPARLPRRPVTGWRTRRGRMPRATPAAFSSPSRRSRRLVAARAPARGPAVAGREASPGVPARAPVGGGGGTGPGAGASVAAGPRTPLAGRREPCGMAPDTLRAGRPYGPRRVPWGGADAARESVTRAPRGCQARGLHTRAIADTRLTA